MRTLFRLSGILSLIAVTVLASAACTSSPASTTSAAATQTSAPSAATVAIISPTAGQTVNGNSVTVTLRVSNFNVVDKQGQASVPGEGHVHFYLDIDAPTTPGKPAVPASGVWAHVSGTTYTFTNVAPGSHTIVVQLVNNDHTPLIPLVTAQVTITVAAGTTTTTSSPPTTTVPTTSSPPPTTPPTTTPASMSITIANFAFSPASITVQAGTTVTWTNKDSTTHTVTSDTGAFDSGNLAPNGTYSYKFTTAGSFAYHCAIHPYMKATVTVQ